MILMNTMKRFLSFLLLAALLLAVPVYAAPDSAETTSDAAASSVTDTDSVQTGSGAPSEIIIRAVCKTTCEALGEDYFYLYANCLAFPVASVDGSTYYLTDATIYDFPAIVTASRESIRTYFEANHILGLDMTDYAGEFSMTGASIEAVIGDKTYSPRLLYASDTYAIIVISDAPHTDLFSYTEQSFAGQVTYCKLSGQAFGLNPEPPTLNFTISTASTIFSESDDGKTLTSSDTILLRSAGSPLLTPDGVVCGFVYCDAETGEPRLTGLEGLGNKFKQLGITLDSSDISEEQQKAIAASKKAEEAAKASASGVLSNGQKDNNSSGSSKILRTVISVFTALAAVVIVGVIVIIIMHNVNKKRRLKAKRANRSHGSASQRPPKISRPSAIMTAAAAIKNDSPSESDTPKANTVSAPSDTLSSAPSVSTDATSVSAEVPEVSQPPKVSIPASEASASVPSVPAAVRPASAMLAVLNGVMKGVTLNVANTVIIGRDSRLCQMVFDESETLISRKHCQITFKPDSGDLILEDLHSLTGTFTPDGRRYAAGRRYLLHNGDRFYLGSKENMIEVRKS